jgi:hypothetical protein
VAPDVVCPGPGGDVVNAVRHGRRRVMLLTTAFFLGAAVGSLEVHAQPLQNEILVGEPLKLQVTWCATEHIEVWPERLGLVVTGPGEVIEGEVRIKPVRLRSPVEPGSPLVTTMPILHRDYLRAKGTAARPSCFPVRASIGSRWPTPKPKLYRSLGGSRPHPGLGPWCPGRA